MGDSSNPLYVLPITQRRWSVWEENGVFTIQLWGHVDVETVVEAVDELAERVLAHGRPIDLVTDLFEVDGFDVQAPVAAVRAAMRMVALVRHCEIIVVNKIVRIAAVSASHLLGVPCSVREHRD